MKRSGSSTIIILIALIIVLSLVIVLLRGDTNPLSTHSFSKTSKDTPRDFNRFLRSCSELEWIQMLQALQQLPSGLFSENYNNVNPEDVLKAVRAGKIERSAVSASAVRKALVWRSYHKTTYLFRSDDEVDYHTILQWAAKKSGLSKREISNLSTYELEKRVSHKFFTIIWEKLTPQEKQKALRDLKNKKDLTDLKNDALETVFLIEELMKDPQGVLLGIVLKGITNAVGYTFADSDNVCMFIMTVSMIKSKG